jgi:anti-sigma B factor antagonist
MTTTEMGDKAILHCKGRLQFCEEAAVFSKLAHGVLDAGQNLILDLSQVEMIDSSAIGELVLIHMRACAAGKEIRIASPKKRVLDVLELTYVSSLFRIYPTLDEALGYLPEALAQAADSTTVAPSWL